MPGDDGFPHKAKKYLCETCCCGVVHCTVGALRLGKYHIAMTAVGLLFYLMNISFTFHYLIQVLLLFFQIFIGVLFIKGIKKMKASLVWPFMVYNFIIVAVLAFTFVFFLIGAVIPYEQLAEQHKYLVDDENNLIRWAFAISAILVAIALLISYWFYNITHRVWRYIQDVRMYELQADLGLCA